MGGRMKKLLDYIESIFPLSDTQKQHIFFLVSLIVDVSVKKARAEEYLKGHKMGFRAGENQGRITKSSMSNEELEDFYRDFNFEE
jgi:hypothetical protein